MRKWKFLEMHIEEFFVEGVGLARHYSAVENDREDTMKQSLRANLKCKEGGS